MQWLRALCSEAGTNGHRLPASCMARCTSMGPCPCLLQVKSYAEEQEELELRVGLVWWGRACHCTVQAAACVDKVID